MNEIDYSANYGLGRLRAYDGRDKQFLMAAVLPEEPSIKKYRSWWGYRYHLDQGYKPECVAYSWTHFLVDSPMTHDPATLKVTPDWLYNEAQKVDEWPGEDYDGTSVRAGAKVLQSLEMIAEYRWATKVDEIIQCLLEQGPVLMGTNWYTGMFKPDALGYVNIEGQVEGGHAYKIDAVNTIAKRARIKNSWGRDWGRHGFAFISFDDLERLLSEDGEACLALEV